MFVTSSLPLELFAPAKVPPEALQDVALVELQVSVELPPCAMEVGFAERVAVGAGLLTGGPLPLDPPLQADRSRTPRVAQVSAYVLDRITLYTDARADTGVGKCLFTAPGPVVRGILCGQSRCDAATCAFPLDRPWKAR